MNNPTIKKATFDPKVKTYIFIITIFYLAISFVGLFILPIWLLGLGQFVSRKFFATLKCELTAKHLRFSKGLIVHIEKTIPLENIQDLSFIGGPILRSFGLSMIKVETAGGGGPNQSNMMSMIGIENAEEFKSLILQQRELVMKEKSGFGTIIHSETKDTEIKFQESQNLAILTEIKNELVAIKEILKEEKK